MRAGSFLAFRSSMVALAAVKISGISRLDDVIGTLRWLPRAWKASLMSSVALSQ